MERGGQVPAGAQVYQVALKKPLGLTLTGPLTETTHALTLTSVWHALDCSSVCSHSS